MGKRRAFNFNFHTFFLLVGLAFLLVVAGFATLTTLTQRQTTKSKASETIQSCPPGQEILTCHREGVTGICESRGGCETVGKTCADYGSDFKRGSCPSLSCGDGKTQLGCYKLLGTFCTKLDFCADSNKTCLDSGLFDSCPLDSNVISTTPNPSSPPNYCPTYGKQCSNSSQCTDGCGEECNTTVGTPGYGTCTFLSSQGPCAINRCANNKCVDAYVGYKGGTNECPVGNCTYDSDCISGPTSPPATPTSKPSPTTVPRMTVDVKRRNGNAFLSPLICQVECNANGKQCQKAGACVKNVSSVSFTRGTGGETRGFMVRTQKEGRNTLGLAGIILQNNTPTGITNADCGTTNEPAICYVWKVSTWTGGTRSILMELLPIPPP